MSKNDKVKPPIQPLTIFLLKTGTSCYEDALEKAERLHVYEIKDDLRFEGALFLAEQRRAVPKWFAFLESGTAGSLEERFNASSSAILFVRAARRLLAFVFGYGRTLLDPERIERSFGLRVVLNAVDAAGLRSVDTKTVQELTVHTRRQTSRKSALAEFGVDKEEDILGAIAGIPRVDGFGSIVSGFDALQLRVPIEFKDLRPLCLKILRIYRSDEYRRQGFAFVDHVRALTDPGKKSKLDQWVVDSLIAQEFDSIHMAPPEIVDWARIEGFGFVKSAAPETDLELTSFFDQIRDADKLSIERLKRQRVFVHLASISDPEPSWPVYRTLVAECDHNGHRFVLSGGEWYEIDQTFAQSVENKIRRIRTAGLNLPAAESGEREDDYNARAAEGAGLQLLDRTFSRVDGDPIELCDLYGSSRLFIHIKRWKASSALSHLFAQGRVSAEAFLSDERFRREARAHLRALARSLESHIPIGRPDPGRYTVVFGIIKDGQGWRRSLPFFSQLQLVRTAEALRRLGFEVRIERIGVNRAGSP